MAFRPDLHTDPAILGPLVSGAAPKTRLQELEMVIARGIKVFVEVGKALLEIRDDKLYRESCRTFEEYLRKRWNWSTEYAYRVMTSVAVTEQIKEMMPMGIVPQSERVARELSPLRAEPERMQEVWKRVLERSPGRLPTAAMVRREVAALRSPGLAGNKSLPITLALKRVAVLDSIREVGDDCLRLTALARVDPENLDDMDYVRLDEYHEAARRAKSSLHKLAEVLF